MAALAGVVEVLSTDIASASEILRNCAVKYDSARHCTSYSTATSEERERIEHKKHSFLRVSVCGLG